jgi:hypothetical protein
VTSLWPPSSASRSFEAIEQCCQAEDKLPVIVVRGRFFCDTHQAMQSCIQGLRRSRSQLYTMTWQPRQATASARLPAALSAPRPKKPKSGEVSALPTLGEVTSIAQPGGCRTLGMRGHDDQRDWGEHECEARRLRYRERRGDSPRVGSKRFGSGLPFRVRSPLWFRRLGTRDFLAVWKRPDPSQE